MEQPTTADQGRVEHRFAEAADYFRGRDVETAERVLREILQRTPDHAPSLNLLALIAGRAGRDAECVALLERAVACSAGPAAAASAGLLGAAHERSGRWMEAEAAYRRAMTIAPHEAEAPFRLGLLLLGQGRVDEAADCFESAAQRQPTFVDALYNLATARKDQLRTDEAVALLRDVVALVPDLAAARLALCMAHLPPVYVDTAEVEQRRADYAAALEDLAAYADRHGAAPLAPGVGAAQPFQLAYQGGDGVVLQRRYGDLVCRAMAEAYPPTVLAETPRDGERIRLGVVCGFFRDHSVWRLPTRGWVEQIDRTRFELIGYHTGAATDAETLRAEAGFDRFVQGPLPFDTWRERIAADRPHALIYPEVGIDPMAARLAALRLAPVQYASWGHPVTTGYPTIDGYLSSEAMEPAAADDQYTERLIRLPGLSTPVKLEPYLGPVASRAALGLAATATVYWCGQSLSKYLPEHDAVFAEIALRVPDSQFVFVAFPAGPALKARFQARLDLAFAALGLDPAAFCVWLPPMSSEAFLAAMGAADVVLDSIGWSGCNTVLSALRHRLAVVTLPGATMRSRHGAAILGAVGLPSLICETRQAYVDTAAALPDAEARRAIAVVLERDNGRLADRRATQALEDHMAAALSDLL